MDGVVDGWDVGVEELLTNGDGGVTYSAESALTPDKHNYSVRESCLFSTILLYLL